MKISASFMLTPLCLLGCFMSNDDDPSSRRSKVIAGFYKGDYTWIDTSSRNTVESEFYLDPRGNYRMLTLLDNEAWFASRGVWKQREDAFFFEEIQATQPGSDPFFEWDTLKNADGQDTSEIREISDTSFVRKEYTVFRQKPYWIAYKKSTPEEIPEGHFRFSEMSGPDSLRVQMRVELDLKPEGKFFLSQFKDTLAIFQIEASWRQAGSFLDLTRYRYRNYVDSLKGFPPVWDTVSGEYFNRVGAISDTAIELWSPGSPFSRGRWDSYKKTE